MEILLRPLNIYDVNLLAYIIYLVLCLNMISRRPPRSALL